MLKYAIIDIPGKGIPTFYNNTSESVSWHTVHTGTLAARYTPSVHVMVMSAAGSLDPSPTKPADPLESRIQHISQLFKSPPCFPGAAFQ